MRAKLPQLLPAAARKRRVDGSELSGLTSGVEPTTWDSPHVRHSDKPMCLGHRLAPFDDSVCVLFLLLQLELSKSLLGLLVGVHLAIGLI